MVLVAYSDSEGSDDDTQQAPVAENANKQASNFTIDKLNPGTVKISLQQTIDHSSTHDQDDEPAAKRPRTGNGAFSGFNSMLPAPKRDGIANTRNETSKTSTRKIFSLKTGAEASFSRESDVELRSFLSEQETSSDRTQMPTSSPSLPKPAFAKPAPPAVGSTPFMFKPLSVAQNGKKKKNVVPTKSQIHPQAVQHSVANNSLAEDSGLPMTENKKKKISLFSTGTESTSISHEIAPGPDEIDNEYVQEDFLSPEPDPSHDSYNAHVESNTQSQSLDSIASDLNLTPAQRRQLFGRSGQPAASVVNVVNFNTDEEYAANQALIAAGETVQHNPVRAIAPGKHSLRQLVNAAAGQKEALEESFAEGKRNKREAGSKYGW